MTQTVSELLSQVSPVQPNLAITSHYGKHDKLKIVCHLCITVYQHHTSLGVNDNVLTEPGRALVKADTMQLVNV